VVAGEPEGGREKLCAAIEQVIQNDQFPSEEVRTQVKDQYESMCSGN